MIKFYEVGGCVRDDLLGVRTKDIDFAVEAPSYEEMRDELVPFRDELVPFVDAVFSGGLWLDPTLKGP